MKSLIRRTLAALIVIAVFAGCTTTPQEPWFDLQDRLRSYNAAD